MTGGKSPHQHVWEAVRRLHARSGALTTTAITRQSGQGDKTTQAYLGALAKAGIIAKQRRLAKRDAQWLLLQDQGAEAPQVNHKGQRSYSGLALENIWRALRIVGELSAAEAAEQASINAVLISEAAARVYLQGLCSAGYLSRVAGTAGLPTRYRLVPDRNTGPQPPQYQRSSYEQLFDPNLNQKVWSKGEEGDAAELCALRLECDGMNRTLAEVEYFLANRDTSQGQTRAEVRRLLARVRASMQMCEVQP
jgi:hypothetical protein